jgi:hypothetical protein
MTLTEHQHDDQQRERQHGHERVNRDIDAVEPVWRRHRASLAGASG